MKGTRKWLTCAVLGAHFACSGKLALLERDHARGGQAGGSGGEAAGQRGGGDAAGQDSGGEPAGQHGGGTGGAVPASILIDDFEDGDSDAAGPLGWWYPTNDRTGTQGWGIEPVSTPFGSTLAMRTHGEGFTDWGALIGVNLMGEALVDASELEVLRLWARLGAGSEPQITVRMLDADRAEFSQPLAVSETWTEYRLPLGEFRNEDGLPVDTSGLSAIHFVFALDRPFELWLDDLAFE